MDPLPELPTVNWPETTNEDGSVLVSGDVQLQLVTWLMTLNAYLADQLAKCGKEQVDGKMRKLWEGKGKGKSPYLRKLLQPSSV